MLRLVQRPLFVFTAITMAVLLYLNFLDSPRLSMVNSKRTARLLFQVDRHHHHRATFKPVKKSQLDWTRPRDGIVPALRHYSHILSKTAPLDDVDVFWRDFYEQELLGWLLPRGPARFLQNMQPGKAVVVCGGGVSFQRVALLLRSLRAMSCQSVVEVYHCSKDAFEDRQVAWIRDTFGVEPVLIDALFPKHRLVNITPETLKLFAAMASPYQELVLVDSDAVLFTCPADFFSDPDYSKHRSVFFKDRELHPHNDALVLFLLDKLFPQPLSPQLAKGAIFAQRSSFQHDSTLCVVDKRVAWLGLAAAIAFTSDPVRQAWGGNFQGDKEAWWMGWEAAGLDYAFERHPPASIGFLHEQEGQPAVCGGKILHFAPGGGTKRAGWASGGVDRPDNDGPHFDSFKAVTDGSGKWTLGLCQIDKDAVDLAVGDAYGLRDKLAMLKSIYQADPLLAS